MPRLRVHGYSVSLDGYGAGPAQSVENPQGVGAMSLHEWAFATRTFRTMFAQEGGTTGIDDDFAALAVEQGDSAAPQVELSGQGREHGFDGLAQVGLAFEAASHIVEQT